MKKKKGFALCMLLYTMMTDIILAYFSSPKD